VRVLAEIPARSSPDLPAGTLRRCDLEAFGGLLEELRESRSVLMTGAGLGRQQAAVGLAAAAAAAGTRTALLECDLSEPELADALGLANAPGLHEYLRGASASGRRGAVGVEQILNPVVLAGPGSAEATEPLVCVVAGRPSHEAARLFASDALARVLSGLRAAYDFVVVLGPRLEEWGALSLLWDHVDATIACLDRAESNRELSFPVAGVVIQD
jgi:Mrp family chromosome partitioning ATPase